MEGFKSYKKQIDEVRGNGVTVFQDKSYEAALIAIKKYIQEKKMKNNEVSVDSGVNDRKFFEERKKKYREYIKSAIAELRLRVDDYDTAEFIEEALSDIAGYSILEDAFSDDEITDIFVNTDTEIFVEKKGETIPYWKKFRSKQHYWDTVERFMKEAGKELNGGDKKIVHFELFQNRGCIIHNSVSTKEISMTFRKHGYSNITKEQLIRWNVMTQDMADFIGVAMRGELNIIIAGITGTGKTTSLQAIAKAELHDKRVLINEDTQELQLDNPNTLQLLSFKGKTRDETVELSDLIETSLRLKPRTNMIGEIRDGKSALAAVESAETGHSTIFTMHGGEPINIVNRLVTKYLTAMPSLGIEVVERIIGSAIDYICIQDAIPGTGRRMTFITEVSYNFEERRVELTPIYEYDFEIKDFVKLNNIDKSKVRTMYRRGIQPEELKRCVDRG